MNICIDRRWREDHYRVSDPRAEDLPTTHTPTPTGHKSYAAEESYECIIYMYNTCRSEEQDEVAAYEIYAAVVFVRDAIRSVRLHYYY